jgi:hypothetical protein
MLSLSLYFRFADNLLDGNERRLLLFIFVTAFNIANSAFEKP